MTYQDFSQLAVTEIKPSEASDFFRRHYLKKKPGTVKYCFGLWNSVFLVGVITYSIPPRETCTRYGCDVLEFSRMFVLDTMMTNTETWFIARTIKILRKIAPMIGAIVTYADTAAGHIGTVYKAANFISDGYTDDDRRTPRFDLWSADLTHRFGRASHATGEVARVRRSKKLRYVYWIKTSSTLPPKAIRTPRTVTGS